MKTLFLKIKTAILNMLASEETGLNLLPASTPETVIAPVDEIAAPTRIVTHTEGSVAKDRSKTRILKWAHKYGRLPSRKADSKRERSLGSRMENYLSVAHPSYDSLFRTTLLTKFPRKPNNKRTHNKEARIAELKSFLGTHGRLPQSRNVSKDLLLDGESLARTILDNYASPYSRFFDLDTYIFVKKIDPAYGRPGMPIAKRSGLGAK